MKKIVGLTLIAISMCLSGFSISKEFLPKSKPWEISQDDLKIINILDISSDELSEIMEENNPNLAIEFSEHTNLPFNFYLKGDLINLISKQEDVGQLEIKQTFYLRCVDRELILSSDLSEWKSFLEFVTGNASFAISIRDKRPSIELGSEANRRI